MRAVLLRTVAVVTALTALASVVAVAGREPVRGIPSAPDIVRQTPETFVLVTPDFPVEGALPPETFPEDEESGADWLRWLAGAVGAILVVALLIALLRNPGALWALRPRRRGGRAEPEEPDVVPQPPEDEIHATRRAVDAALEPLRDPTDPRQAVIAAYARMQGVLAARELGRRTPEAPREYLARVLRARGVPERSLTTLTRLFEEARFSTHPIPDSAPQQAREELERARATLTG